MGLLGACSLAGAWEILGTMNSFTVSVRDIFCLDSLYLGCETPHIAKAQLRVSRLDRENQAYGTVRSENYK